MHHNQLQSSLQPLTEEPSFTSSVLVRRLFNEDQLAPTRAKRGVGSATALTASRDKISNLHCTNCKKTKPTVDYCIKPGGKMAGRTIDEACAAQRAASKASRGGSNRTHSA
jgi:hypothetical protein